MKNKLSIRAKFFLPIMFIPFLTFLIIVAALSFILWLVRLVLVYSGISESINFYFDISRNKMKRSKFRQDLRTSEEKIREHNEKNKFKFN